MGPEVQLMTLSIKERTSANTQILVLQILSQESLHNLVPIPLWHSTLIQSVIAPKISRLTSLLDVTYFLFLITW